MRKTHLDFIGRWVTFMRENPTKWKKIHTEFINAQFQKNEEFLQRLRKMPKGKQKIINLYEIKNTKGFEQLLG
jgi:hypothetical protein